MTVAAIGMSWHSSQRARRTIPFLTIFIVRSTSRMRPFIQEHYARRVYNIRLDSRHVDEFAHVLHAHDVVIRRASNLFADVLNEAPRRRVSVDVPSLIIRIVVVVVVIVVVVSSSSSSLFVSRASSSTSS